MPATPAMLSFIKKNFNFLFGFSAGEAGAFTVLMPMLGLVLYSEPIWDHFNPSPSPVIEVTLLDSLLESEPPVHMFPFDPNTISADGLDSLGVDEQLSARLIRYRTAGGRFRKPHDLLRLHGLDTSEFRRLEPWININAATTGNQQYPERPKSAERRFGSALKTPRTFDLNRADTIDFEAWPGIGHKTAVRIMRYRDALGGFLKREQLYEVWGIDSLTIFSMDKFYVDPGFRPYQIDVNTATEDELEHHPYLSRQQARAILFYRFQHGNFRTMDDLKQVRLLDEAVQQRIRPYVAVKTSDPE